MQYLVYFKCV